MRLDLIKMNSVSNMSTFTDQWKLSHATPAVCGCRLLMTAIFARLLLLSAAAQPVYFVDGYHGGVYGHYPESFTKFIVDSLRKNPAWKISLEIEPETWDVGQTNAPQD